MPLVPRLLVSLSPPMNQHPPAFSSPVSRTSHGRGSRQEVQHPQVLFDVLQCLRSHDWHLPRPVRHVVSRGGVPRRIQGTGDGDHCCRLHVLHSYRVLRGESCKQLSPSISNIPLHQTNKHVSDPIVKLLPCLQAHHQKIYALILYSIIIFMFIGGNVILWGVKPEFLVLDPESRTVYAVCGLFLILMVIGVVLSWQIRSRSRLARQEQANSPTMEQTTTATHQKMNNNQLPASSSYIHMSMRSGAGPTHQIPISYQ